MLEYHQVGELVGGSPARTLLLPNDRPLSYLRVEDEGHRTETLARALLGERATEFRRRVPLALEEGEGLGELSTTLRRFRVSTVAPLLQGRDAAGGSPLTVAWLDRAQLLAHARANRCMLRRGGRSVRIGGVNLRPTVETVPASGSEIAEEVDESWQYWGSRWEFEQPPGDSDGWWRVWPNLHRNRAGMLGRHAAARGTSAACLSPSALRRLGTPHYLVVEHPFRSGAIPVLAIADESLEQPPEELAGDSRAAICLDRTARDALGIADGEFCFVHPWQQPRLDVARRRLRDRYVGSRAISANVRTSARADLEKPVCRVEEESLDAIGGTAGEFVTLESVRRAGPANAGGQVEHWRRLRIKQRVVAISSNERTRRDGWEAGQPWDDGSVSPAWWPAGQRGIEPEGFVDCAETLAVHPPYPTVYLNFNTRQELELALCQPVEIRVNVLSRMATEFGNLAWLVLIGLIGTIAALLSLSIATIAAMLAVTLGVLLALRAVRTIR